MIVPTVAGFAEELARIVNSNSMADEDYANGLNDLGIVCNEVNDVPEILDNLINKTKTQCSSKPEQWNRAAGLLLPPKDGLRFD